MKSAASGTCDGENGRVKGSGPEGAHLTAYQATDRSSLRRVRDRGSHERAAVYDVVDEALVAHVGFAGPDRQPYVIPTSHARVGDTLYFHGAHGSRLLRALQSGEPVCITFTLVDGLVLARSWTNHSVNYRSAVVFGRGRKVSDPDERWAALRALVEHAMPGRTSDAKSSTARDRRATGLAAVEIEEASVKSRSDGPHDDEEDLDLPVWAGVIPLSVTAGVPEPSTDMRTAVPLPGYVAEGLHRRRV